ncbi:hypothetical protein B7P43_G17931 [Cryptotermes secundus]|uniref:Uncharacterized protein n=1 Tax=Cryptotermes secundus TaxID=105785 RepID=A0A2J7QVL1_9NEOP|nr:uncharacterized protein LOC111865083 isoform X1 [Cryptotermes secundus]XP_033607571.1 uncharacterized protein LOC111865083 isoform X1 [Cryptotermes secundus]PNF32621.1 hypothetical protein B7P43_G17931 [Cryptotermes secundus]
MPFPRCPDQLSDLAIDAFVKYVAGLPTRLVALSRLTKIKEFKQNIQEMCRCLAVMIQNAVPPVLAREVTIKVLQALNDTFLEMKTTANSKWLHRIMPEVAFAVIHPTVTSLECFEEKLHPTTIDYYKLRRSDLIFHDLHKMKNLKVLNLVKWHKRGLNDQDITGNLERVSFHGCHDCDLEVLSRCCKDLKSLDISYSSQVTNRSVDSILRFQHLEELTIHSTSITRRGQRKMLRRFAEMRMLGNDESSPSAFLKRFACQNPRDTHIWLLTETFQNLTSLSVTRIRNCNLNALKRLKHLSALTLKHGDFSHVEELLAAIGRQLISLHLELIEDLNFMFIVRTCISVRCLGLLLYTEFPPSGSCSEHFSGVAALEYPSVRCLHIGFKGRHSCDSALSYFVNLKKLYVNCAMNSRLFGKILTREELKYLEEFVWHRPETHTDALVQFSEQCSAIYLFGYNNKRSSFRKYIVSNEYICIHSERYFRHICETQL